MSHLYPVFNVIKLTPATDNPFPGRRIPPPPPPEIIHGEEEWVVEEILDSKVINRRLRYLVKWKDFSIEHKSWEPWDNVHAPDLIANFYCKHPGAARHIRSIEFQSIPFQPIAVLRHHSLKGRGVDARELPTPRPLQYGPLYVPPSPRHFLSLVWSCLAAHTHPQSDSHVLSLSCHFYYLLPY